MDAHRFLAEFGHIANAPEGIVRLRELILCLAMQGKLVAQRLDEPSVATLLEHIALDKKRLIKSGAIKSPKPLPEVSRSEMSHALPENWAWVRFGDIAMHNSGKTLDSVRNSGQPRDYITTSNLYWGRFELSNVKKMLIREGELEKCTARNNDLLICEGGEAGRAAVWISDYEVCFQNHVHRARFYGGVNPFFSYRFFEKLKSTGEINAHRKGIGISNMSSKALAMIPFPLPPLEEQARIVAKVDELMALCDKLEAQQQDRRKLQNKLRQSTLQAVAAATSPHELQTTWTRLANSFGMLFDAPEDVNLFKSLVLRLAARGLLVKQSSADTPATELLKNIDAERRQLISEKKIKGGITLPPIKEDDYPYQLPKGWVWARVIDLVDVGTGSTPAKSEPSYYGGDVPWYTSSATNEIFARHPQTFITQKALKETNCKVFPVGSLIIALYGQGKTRGQISELMIPGATNQALAAMVFFNSSLGVKGYLKYFFKKIYDEIRSQAEGGPQPNLNVGKIKETLIPVPPIEEQTRIVSKLDQLMAQCDRFGEQLRSKKTVAEKFAVALVESITGIATEQEEEPMKAPQTELIALLRLGKTPDIKAQAPLATILVRHNGEMPAKNLWQRFGGEIDAFYAQLKTEVAHGWIVEPAMAEMREKRVESADA
jgi:type I restriction enzyme S subunit